MKLFFCNGVYFGNDSCARYFGTNDVNARENYFSCC